MNRGIHQMIAIKMIHGYSYASLDCTNSSHKAERAAVAMIVWKLDSQLPIQAVPITHRHLFHSNNICPLLFLTSR